jgi:hypothetical protein
MTPHRQRRILHESQVSWNSIQRCSWHAQIQKGAISLGSRPAGTALGAQVRKEISTVGLRVLLSGADLLFR